MSLSLTLCHSLSHSQTDADITVLASCPNLSHLGIYQHGTASLYKSVGYDGSVPYGDAGLVALLASPRLERR